MSGVLVIT